MMTSDIVEWWLESVLCEMEREGRKEDGEEGGAERGREGRIEGGRVG